MVIQRNLLSRSEEPIVETVRITGETFEIKRREPGCAAAAKINRRRRFEIKVRKGYCSIMMVAAE